MPFSFCPESESSGIHTLIERYKREITLFRLEEEVEVLVTVEWPTFLGCLSLWLIFAHQEEETYCFSEVCLS